MIAIEHVKGINRRGLMTVIAEGWNEILQAGNGEDAVCPNWDQEAIVAKVDGDVAGVLTFVEFEAYRHIWIYLSYVRPRYRRQGLFRKMFDRLTEIAREREVPEIQSGVSARNTTMQKVNARLGRKVESLTYSYKVTDKND